MSGCVVASSSRESVKVCLGLLRCAGLGSWRVGGVKVSLRCRYVAERCEPVQLSRVGVAERW